jgi:18S rRNA (adenine1779-N6/adenine1780-N6)-dimethyltransferase
MPRAVKTHFSRVHDQPLKVQKPQPGSVVNNPLFDTARFGQHILKNPAISQEIVDAVQSQASLPDQH